MLTAEDVCFHEYYLLTEAQGKVNLLRMKQLLREMRAGIYFGILKEREHLKDLVVNGRTILKLTL